LTPSHSSQHQLHQLQRSVHIDYAPESARIMLRNFNPEVWEATKDIIEAEDDAAAFGTEYKGRRYAFLGVWRPLKTVTKDSLSVCDPNAIDREKDLSYHPLKNRVLKGIILRARPSLMGPELRVKSGIGSRSRRMKFISFSSLTIMRKGMAGRWESPIAVQSYWTSKAERQEGELRPGLLRFSNTVYA
jgi:hypothetical protein